MKFYDISLPIAEGMIVYPDNPQPSIVRYASIPTDKMNELIITIGSHTGTHVNSRLHIITTSLLLRLLLPNPKKQKNRGHKNHFTAP